MADIGSAGRWFGQVRTCCSHFCKSWGMRGTVELSKALRTAGVHMKLVLVTLLGLSAVLAGCASSARIVDVQQDGWVVVQFGSPREARALANDHCESLGKSATLRRSETTSGSGERRVYQCE